MLNRINEIDLIESFLGMFKTPANEVNDSLKTASYQEIELISIKSQNLFLSIKPKCKRKIKTINFEGRNFNTTAFFWGEIYNFDELCNYCGVEIEQTANITYSELCCLLFNKYGIGFASRINGIFSIILNDGSAGELYLYADRFGSARPLYYYNNFGKLLFSNKFKLLSDMDEISNEINLAAMTLFLKYSYIPAPGTMIKGIQKICPGEVVIFNGNSLITERYVNFEFPSNKISDQNQAIEFYSQTLEASVLEKMQTTDQQKVGFFLSGGLDSSANVAFAALNRGNTFETFGVGFENKNLDERPYAKIVANHFGLKFNDYVFTGSEIDDLPLIVKYFEEPFMENGLFLTYAGFKSINNRADVVIAGDGADQLFGTGGFAFGRPIALRYIFDKLKIRQFIDILRMQFKNKLFYQDNLLYKIKVMLNRAVDFNDWFFWGFDINELKQLCKYPVLKQYTEIFHNKLKNKHVSFFDHYDFSIIHQDIEHYVCQNVLSKSFRMADIFDIRIREAYLDVNVINCLSEIATSLKTKGDVVKFLKGERTTKYLHRMIMNNILPKKILTKPKQGGFVPMSLLLKNEKKRQAIYKYILDSDFIKCYFNINFIKILINQYERSISCKTYWQAHTDSKVNQIMNLLILSLWAEIIL